MRKWLFTSLSLRIIDFKRCPWIHERGKEGFYIPLDKLFTRHASSFNLTSWHSGKPTITLMCFMWGFILRNKCRWVLFYLYRYHIFTHRQGMSWVYIDSHFLFMNVFWIKLLNSNLVIRNNFCIYLLPYFFHVDRHTSIATFKIYSLDSIKTCNKFHNIFNKKSFWTFLT